MARKPAAATAADTISKVYLFTGEADSRRKSTLENLLQGLVDPAFEGFDMERLDGDQVTGEHVLSAAATLPFGSPRKVVIVNRIDRMNADGQSKIAAFLPKLGDHACLILLTSGETPAKAEESDTKKSKKGLQSELSTAVKKNGKVVTFAALKGDAVTALVQDAVKAAGKSIAPQALHLLSRSVSAHPALAACEVEKLATYVGERETITPADVEAVITESPEDRVFPLVDAIAAGNADTVVKLLSETLLASAKADNEVLRLLSMIARHFRLLYQAKFILTQPGVRSLKTVPEELAAMTLAKQSPLTMSDWQQGKLVQQANHFTLAEIRRALASVLECEADIKGQGTHTGSPRLLLEMLVLKLSDRR